MAIASAPIAAHELGEYICEANPFTQEMELRLDQAEVDTASLAWPHREWPFKKEAYHVTQALRIPYHYTDDDNILRRKYLLIGFATYTGE